MKYLQREKIVTLILLAVFAIAMGFLEGVVVYYLRLLPLQQSPEYPSVPNLTNELLLVEQLREAATIMMLVSLALVVGKNKWQKLFAFIFAFSIWDLFYYVSLYFLINWPTSLLDLDVVFLIPFPWIFPVWFPVGLFLVLSVFSGYRIIKSKN
jgi:hypothetical protein